MAQAITNQTGGLQFHGGADLTDYSLFVGGINASNNALKHYTPLVSGYRRLFVVRPPWFVIDYFKNYEGGSSWYSPNSLWIQAKHILEYAFMSVTGITDPQIDTDQLQGGYAGRTLQIPTGRSGHTTSVTITVPEFSGSPMRQVFRDVWMNGIIDEISGATTYQGKVAVDRYNNPAFIPEGETIGTASRPGIGKPVNEAYHSAEIIVVDTDRSLMNVENALMLAHVYPTQVQETLDYSAGQHELVSCAITFNVVQYRSNPVTAIADKLLKQYYVSCNSMNMNPELGSIFNADGSINTDRMGRVPQERSNNTMLGNTPAYTYTSTYTPKRHEEIELNQGKRFDPPPHDMDNNTPDFTHTYSPLAIGRNDD